MLKVDVECEVAQRLVDEILDARVFIPSSSRSPQFCVFTNLLCTPWIHRMYVLSCRPIIETSTAEDEGKEESRHQDCQRTLRPSKFSSDSQPQPTARARPRQWVPPKKRNSHRILLSSPDRQDPASSVSEYKKNRFPRAFPMGF